jgi:hypothetical protein
MENPKALNSDLSMSFYLYLFFLIYVLFFHQIIDFDIVNYD